MPKLTLPAFESRNYQLFFIGQGISLIGTWMTQLATVWLIYHLTQSAWLLGLASFVSQVPSILLVPFGGVFVDRWNHHRTLLFTQTLAMLQSFALAALTLTGSIQVWSILLLGFCQGLINAVDVPTRQAFVPEIVDRKDNLGNAIALNSSMVTGAKLIGPALGGLLVASVGAGYCFLIDGFSYVAVLAGLLAMRLPAKVHTRDHARDHAQHQQNPHTAAPSAERTAPQSVWANLQEGIAYTLSVPPICIVLLLVAWVSFMGFSPSVVLPIFAATSLRGNAHTLGMLMAAVGVGALIGAISLTQRRGIRGLGRLIAIAPAILGVGMIGFAFSQTLWLSLLLLVVIGFGTLLQTACSNTLIQTLVADDKRGRVMSLYVVAFLGMSAVGNLFTGSVISIIGSTQEVALSGGFCILAAVIFARKLPKLRQIVRASYPELLTHDAHP